jgi:hypothetical protein
VLEGVFVGVLEPEEVAELAGAAVAVGDAASVFVAVEESDFDVSDFAESDFDESDFEPRLSFL